MTAFYLSKEIRFAKAYLKAKFAILAAGYGEEIVHERSRNQKAFTESDLLRESAWVILCCGMKEQIIREKFPCISNSFFAWESSHKIVKHRSRCYKGALGHFNHSRKIKAIIEIAQMIAKEGFDRFKREITADPLPTLQRLPYIGAITSFHLAKNLGLPLAKPDRHLSRIATMFGYKDVQEFCGLIGNFVGEDIQVVDIVLWRYATISKNYLSSLIAEETRL